MEPLAALTTNSRPGSEATGRRPLATASGATAGTETASVSLYTTSSLPVTPPQACCTPQRKKAGSRWRTDLSERSIVRANTLRFALAICLLAARAVPAQQTGAGSELDRLISQQLDSLVATYKNLHASPELSGHEEKTSAFVANDLRSLGYAVTDHVGKYSGQKWAGYDVVALLRNGPDLSFSCLPSSTPCPSKRKPDYPTRAR